MQSAISRLLTGLLVSLLFNCASIPEGESGQAASELAEKMLQAAKKQQWQNQVELVQFRFREKNNYYWDKTRNLVEFKTDELLVQFNSQSFAYVAFKITADGEFTQLEGEEAKVAFDTAYSSFTNDAFWLQPMFHISSPGTKFYKLDDGSLRVTFTSGGVTPGDTYVFVPDENYQIKEMKMWVSILPVKGMGADFSDYRQTEAGIPIARKRDLGILSIPLDQIELYSKKPEQKKDRFEKLLKSN